MHRQPLLQLLHKYKQSYWFKSDEMEIYQKFITFINNQPNCFERSLLSGHLTASCWIWNKPMTKVLLTLHRKLNKWVLLGGHADGDNNLLEVAVKEAQEESGVMQVKALDSHIIDLDIHTFPQKGDVQQHSHYDVRFLLQLDDQLPLKVSHESKDLKWICINHLEDYTCERTTLKVKEKLQQEHLFI